MTTLQELYEYYSAKTLVYRIIVAGADITGLITSVSWNFAVGEVPTATFDVPASYMVPAIAEEAAVEIWAGYRVGLIQRMALVFGDGVIDSVSARGNMRTINCVQNGARKLNYPYYREIGYDFDTVTAEEAVTALLDLAGVNVYHVDLDPWLIGTAVPQRLHFSTYGEAINKVSTVDGTEWYALPSGQIRVEKRDPLPYDNYRRLYYSGILNGITFTSPYGVVDPDAEPRILDVAKEFDRAGVNNFINIDGAALETIGPNGEQNTDQIHEEVDGAPGTFPNGAPWITTPPLFQPFTYSNELIDTDAKAFSVAERYYTLKNRLIQNLTLTVPLDPELFLCMTVKVIDPDTETDDLYFLKSYHCSISNGSVQSDLELLGGPFSGTQGFASPFAEFRWTYSALWKTLGENLGSTGCNSNNNLGFLSQQAAKLCQDLPADTGSPDKGGDVPTTQVGSVFIGFDGTYSQDFDGQIASYAWSDDQGNTGTGPRITFIYNPEDVSSVQVTLEVTDDTGRTDSITKTVYTSASHSSPEDPSMNDTTEGGGEAAGDCAEGGDPNQGGDPPPNGSFLVRAIAAMCKAMMSSDNKTWNMLDKDDLNVGNFISVDLKQNSGDDQEVVALFGTDEGEIVRTTDGAQTGGVVHFTNNNEEISSISFDPTDCGTVVATTSRGQILSSSDMGQTWKSIRPKDDIQINQSLFIGDTLYVFGGDTGKPDTLIRSSRDGGKNFQPVPLQGSLGVAVRAAGPGGSISRASVNDNGIMIGFQGVNELAWTTPDLNRQSWTQMGGLTGSRVTAIGGGNSDGVISTDDGTFTSDDTSGQDFTPTCPNVYNDVRWEGLPGVYMGVDDDQLSKIIDDTCGPMMPNAEIPDQTPMPACAHPKQVKTIIGVYPPTEWPTSVTPPPTGTFTASFREGLGQTGGTMGRTYTVPNNGGQPIMLVRFLSDSGGLFDATDDLSWSAIGQGDELKLDYCLTSGNGQTINWSMNASDPLNPMGYAVYSFDPSTGAVSVVGVDFDQLTGASGQNFIGALCSGILSIYGIGFNNQPLTAASRQSPQVAVFGGGSDLGYRDGSGASPWAGVTGVGAIWYLGAIAVDL